MGQENKIKRGPVARTVRQQPGGQAGRGSARLHGRQPGVASCRGPHRPAASSRTLAQGTTSPPPPPQSTPQTHAGGRVWPAPLPGAVASPACVRGRPPFEEALITGRPCQQHSNRPPGQPGGRRSAAGEKRSRCGATWRQPRRAPRPSRPNQKGSTAVAARALLWLDSESAGDGGSAMP